MERPDGDEDVPWTWATDAGWELSVPAPARAVLAACAQGAEALADGLAVDVRRADGGAETWSGERLASLARDAGAGLAPVLAALAEHEGHPVDADELEALVAAAEALAVLCVVRIESGNPGVDLTTIDLLRWAAATERLHRELTEALMRRIRARRDGTFKVVLDAVEREVIDGGFDQLADALGTDDPALRRLLPTAYPDDPERQAGWAALVHDELIERRRASLTTARTLLDRTRLDAEELSTLMRSCNDLRLVLGTRLDVSEDGWPAGGPGALSEEDRLAAALYEHLGLLVSEMVRALRTTL